MRALLRACMFAVAGLAGFDTYLYGAWWAESLGLPGPAAQILAVLAGLIVTAVLATVPWRIYLAIRRSLAARRPEPVVVVPPKQATPTGPARDAPYREADVLPS